MKKQSGIYEFLEKTGVLTNGSKEDIIHAKKQYWALQRKEWKRRRRTEQKSYTVFLKPHELKQITPHIKEGSDGMTGYIKHAVLSYENTEATVHAKTMGAVRALFFEYYNQLESLLQTHTADAHLTQQLLTLIEQLQEDVLNVLKKQ